MWRHYGHTAFDTLTGLFATINETRTLPGDLIIYMGFPGDQTDNHKADADGRLQTDTFYEEMFSALSAHPLQSWSAFLEQSKTTSICFDDIVIGTSRRIGHYHSSEEMPYFDVDLMRSLSELMQQNLASYTELDLSCKFRVTVLDRQHSRRILNIDELASAVEDHLMSQRIPQHCVDVIDAERLTFSQQYHLFHNTKILVGVDGSGLLNAAFTRYPCSGCVHIKPFLQDVIDAGKEGEFRAFCTKFAGHWQSWQNDNISSVVWPHDFDTDRVELAKLGTKEAHEQLRAIHQSYSVSREPSMHVNVDQIMLHIAKVVAATEIAVCSD